MATFSTTEIIEEIRYICGDLADQFTDSDLLKLSNELENTLYFLTQSYVFYWNLREEELSHTNGVLAATTYGLGKVLFLSDSDENIGYYGGSWEEFYLIKRQSDFTIKYNKETPVPFIITTNRTTGADIITVATLTNTPSTRSFYLVYGETTTTLEPWVPERLRPFMVSYTAANFLVKLDSPNVELVQAHIQVAKQNLDQEFNLGRNKHVIGVNTNLAVSPNLVIGIGGSDNL